MSDLVLEAKRYYDILQKNNFSYEQVVSHVGYPYMPNIFLGKAVTEKERTQKRSALQLLSEEIVRSAYEYLITYKEPILQQHVLKGFSTSCNDSELLYPIKEEQVSNFIFNLAKEEQTKFSHWCNEYQIFFESLKQYYSSNEFIFKHPQIGQRGSSRVFHNSKDSVIEFIQPYLKRRYAGNGLSYKHGLGTEGLSSRFNKLKEQYDFLNISDDTRNLSLINAMEIFQSRGFTRDDAITFSLNLKYQQFFKNNLNDFFNEQKIHHFISLTYDDDFMDDIDKQSLK